MVGNQKLAPQRQQDIGLQGFARSNKLEQWAGQHGLGVGRVPSPVRGGVWEMPIPRKKSNFLFEMACFGTY